MAKSTRSHQRQKNNAALRKRVFAPVDQARAERLSEKLLQIASQPTEKERQKQNEMEVEPVKESTTAVRRGEDDMDIDEGHANKIDEKKSGRKRPSRVQKKRRGKPHNQIIFPALKRDKLHSKLKKSGKK